MIETGLKDKVVIVTGGASGIGLATARRFALEGCKVLTEPRRMGKSGKTLAARNAAVRA